MEPRAVVAGPGAARALRAGGAGRVELAFGGGGYVRLGKSAWLLLAGPRAPVGPLTVLVAGLRPLEPGSDAAVGDGGVLVAGAQRIALRGARGVRPRGPADGRAADSGPAMAAALAGCPEPPGEVRAGIAALERGDLAVAADLLAGRGEGLTPAGDDVLAGYAGWAHAAGEPVAVSQLAAPGASPIGLAYLRCAERGELPDAAAGVIAAVRAGDARAAARRARVLGTWGTSSGAMMLRGIGAAWRAIAA